MIPDTFTLFILNIGWQPPQDGLHEEGFKYSAPSDFSSLDFSTALGTYDGGGYVVSMKDTQRSALEIINSLKAKDWITNYTRALVLEFTIYNVNTNLFSNIKALLEFPEAGGIFHRTYVDSFRPYPYVSVWDFILLTLQLLWVCLTIYMLIKFIVTLFRRKGNMNMTSWICLEALIIALSLSAIITYICRIAGVIKAVETIKNQRGKQSYHHNIIAHHCLLEIHSTKIKMEVC